MTVQNKTLSKRRKTVLEDPIHDKNSREIIARAQKDGDVRENNRSKLLEKLKETLLDRRREIRRFFDEAESQTVYGKNDVQVGDTVDAAMESVENELEYRFVEAESRELGQIERAVQRFEEGTYGICEGCDCPIPIARLKVLPFAENCVKCQQIDDNERNRSAFRGWKTYDYAVSGSHGSLERTDKDYMP